MASMRYLNSILTIIAVLLTVHLWAWWLSPSDSRVTSFTPTAHAQAGLPNAAAQRVQMINEMKQTNAKLDQLTALLKSGKVRVRVEAGANQGK